MPDMCKVTVFDFCLETSPWEFGKGKYSGWL